MRSPSFTTSFAKASIQIAILMNAPQYNIWDCKYRSFFDKGEEEKRISHSEFVNTVTVDC
jgi:hypothetical protein